ncbi:MAG: amidohydrolase family protein [Parvularculaceae bacterium]
MEQSSRTRAGDGAVIFQSTILTMDQRRPAAEAVIVKDGMIVDVGAIDNLVEAYPGASFDERYLRHVLTPAFVDVRKRAAGGTILPLECGGRREAQFAEIERAVADGTSGRVAIEAHRGLSLDEANRIGALGAVIILRDDPLANDCAIGDLSPSPAMPILSGRIALAAAIGETNLLKAAGARLGDAAPIRLAPREALEAITIDAAFALGVEVERGMIAPGLRADFAALDRNPLVTPGESWGDINVDRVEPNAAR